MEQFGLIGKPLSHSFSKQYFTQKFQKENIQDSEYGLYSLDKSEDILALIKNTPNLKGLNVTIPYKGEVIQHLDELDETAKKVGAVNTIKISKNKTKGYNTDVVGFRNSLKPFLEPKHSRALIFGTGGSSKAVAFVLQQLQIPFYYVSRNPSSDNQVGYEDLDTETLKSFKFLINCTPVGMSPNDSDSLPIPFEGFTEDHLVYDLIYNPEETVLLKEAKKRGAIAVNGLSMLKLQAEASWKIWNE